MVCAAALLMVVGTADAQEFAKVGTFGLQFLKIGVGSRGIAMGESYIALSDNGAEAVFWNPAGLEYVERSSLMLSHTEWLADIRYDAAAVAHSLGVLGTVGLSFAMLGSGPMEVTTVDRQEGTGETFDTADYMIGLSFARALTNKFRVGFNFKYIRERLERESASTYAVDVGTIYYSGFRSLRMGMAIRNFGPEVQLSGSYFDFDNGVPLADKSEYEPFHLPLAFQFGLALDIFNRGHHRLIGATELYHPPDNLERINLGGEYTLMDFLAFRGGYSFRHDVKGPSFGLGIDYGLGQTSHVRLDYAYTDFGILDMVQRVSLGIDF
ncbi:PorV/PorQ family protein [candidate division KSB1 bacterium]